MDVRALVTPVRPIRSATLATAVLLAAAATLATAGAAQARPHHGRPSALSGAQANRIAYRVLLATLRGRPAQAYRLPRILGPRAVIAEPGAGHLQAGRTRLVLRNGRAALLTPLPRRGVGRRVWCYWADLLPGAMFPHPALLLLLDARSGHVVRKEGMAWWPMVNGRQYLPFSRRARAAAAGPRGAPFRIGLLRPSARIPMASTGTAADAVSATAPPAPGSRIIEIGDFNAPEAGPNFAAWSQFAIATTGRPAIKAYDAAGLAAAMRDAYNEGARDVVIYVNGHQFAPGSFDLGGQLYDWANRTFTGQQPGPYVSLSSGSGGLGHTWKQNVLTAGEVTDAIRLAKQRSRGLNVSTIVEACGSGNFAKPLSGVADRYITSVGPGKDSLGPPKNGQGPSPFTQAVFDNIDRALGSGVPTLTGAIAQAEPQIAQDTTQMATQQDGYYGPSQQPTYDEQVSGKIIGGGPSCPPKDAYFGQCKPPGGMVAVEFGIAFTLDTGSSGTVEFQPPGTTVSSDSPPPAYGNPAIGDLFFYAAPGSTITLTANHGGGSFFDGWQVHNGGRCVSPYGTPSGNVDGGSPGICSITVSDPFNTGRFYEDARAFFLKCPPPGTFSPRRGAKIDCPGVLGP